MLFKTPSVVFFLRDPARSPAAVILRIVVIAAFLAQCDG
jgi:hypothetical protein